MVVNKILKARLADKYVRMVYLYVWLFASLAGLVMGRQIYEYIDGFIAFAFFTTAFAGIALYIAHRYSKTADRIWVGFFSCLFQIHYPLGRPFLPWTILAGIPRR